MENANLSDFLGFACDTAEVTNEITAMTNAVSEYGPQLNSGVADEATFQACLDKMEAGNVQALIDYYQAQLDSWQNTVQ